MSDQFRRVRSGKKKAVRKGNRSKTFHLAEEIRKAKTENDRDNAVLTFIVAMQDAAIALALTPDVAGDPRLDAIRRHLEVDPSYRPTMEVCAGLANAAVFYATVNELDSGTLRDRLVSIEGDDLPDSLEDPDTI